MTEWGFNKHVEGERRMIRTEGVDGDIEIGLVWLSNGLKHVQRTMHNFVKCADAGLLN